MNNNQNSQKPTSGLIHQIGPELFIRKWTGVLICLGAGFLLSLILNVVIPKSYSSYAVIMPGKPGGGTSSGFRGMTSGSGGIAALIGLGASGDELIRFREMLMSRSLVRGIFSNKELRDEFIDKDEKDERVALEDLVTKTLKDTQISNVDAVIRIDFTSDSPEKAKKMVDAYLNSLQSAINGTMTNQAKMTEAFVSGRLEEAQADLTQLEKSYLELQRSRGVVQLPSQINYSLSTASRLRQDLIQKDMEIALYRDVMRDASEAKRLETEKRQIQAQLDRIISGDGSSKSKSKVELFTPLKQGTELSIEFASVEREFISQIRIVELLRQQLELSRIESKRSTPMFQVIDDPYMPIGPSSPRKLLNLIAGLMIGICAAFAYLFWCVWKENREFQLMTSTVRRVQRARDDSESHPVAFN